jgi:hypothetical protein
MPICYMYLLERVVAIVNLGQVIPQKNPDLWNVGKSRPRLPMLILINH